MGEGATPLGDRTIGKYRIVGRLGGDSRVVRLLGEHAAIGRNVEIHIPADGQGADSEAAQQLLREARVFGGSTHRNLQSVMDSGRDDQGRPFIAYEVLRGSSLEELLIANPAGVGTARAARLVVQLLEALRALHDAGVVLRTLSPVEIMVEPITEVEDLMKVRRVHGAALLIEGGAAPITTIGYSVYLAPELRRGDPGMDPRVDFYSVGVVLRQLLTGHPKGDDSRLSDTARRALARSCATDPDERFATADGFLQSVALLLPTDARPPREEIPAPPDPLSADLQYLHMRRNTRHGPSNALEGDSRMALLPVLLTIEAVYRRWGQDVWARLCAKVDDAESLLPGAGNTPVHLDKGVPVPLFAEILVAVDEIAGSGDLSLVADLGEAVAQRGLARLFPKLSGSSKASTLVESFPYLWSQISRDGDARIRLVSEKKARLWVTNQPTPSLELAGWFAGLLRAAMRETDAVDPKVDLVASEALGDGRDLYGIEWS